MTDQDSRLSNIERSEAPRVREVASALLAGRKPWGPDGPQTVTDWDECAAAWRAIARGAVDALRDIVKVDLVDAALDPQRPLRIAEAWLREHDATETPEQRHYRELHDGTLTVIPPGGDPREKAA